MLLVPSWEPVVFLPLLLQDLQRAGQVLQCTTMEQITDLSLQRRDNCCCLFARAAFGLLTNALGGKWCKQWERSVVLKIYKSLSYFLFLLAGRGALTIVVQCAVNEHSSKTTESEGYGIIEPKIGYWLGTNSSSLFILNRLLVGVPMQLASEGVAGDCGQTREWESWPSVNFNCAQPADCVSPPPPTCLSSSFS